MPGGSTGGQGDDLDFVKNAEQAGADLGGADDRCAAGILNGSEQARGPTSRASQHGYEIGGERLPQVGKFVKKQDVARGHIG